jgi:hypothetical protein
MQPPFRDAAPSKAEKNFVNPPNGDFVAAENLRRIANPGC